MFAASKSGSADAKDPQFNYVTMLLHGNGTNGAQNNTFTDSSTNNFTITRNGNTTQGTFSPYGSNWSNLFATNSAIRYPYTSSLTSWWTQNFTIEMWVFNNTNAVSGTNSLPLQFAHGVYNSTPTYWAFGTNASGQLNFYYYNGGSNNVTSTTAASLGTWNHIAMVYTHSSGNISLYLNGVSVASATKSGTPQNDNTNTVNIGAVQSTYYNGYISNLRVLNGTALYSGSFTPSTTPLTAITNTQLLTCADNRFIDDSTNNATPTIIGSPSIQRFSPFSPTSAYSTSVIGGSGYFDGSGDYLGFPNNTAFDFSTGDFTVEAWVYRVGTGSGSQVYEAIIGGNTSGVSYWTLYVNSSNNTVVWYGNDSTLRSTSNTITNNTWNHVAVSRSSGTLKIFINGVQGYSASVSTSYSLGSGGGGIGLDSASTGNKYFYGYINDTRVVKGTALYTSAFTPPTAPLTAVSGTSLLTNFTNAGILDNAMMNDLETVGNAQISTSVKKYGTGSIALDGTGDYLNSRNPANVINQFGTGDFTVEFWAYLTNSGNDNGPIFDTRSSSGNGLLIRQGNGAGGIANRIDAVITGSATASSGTISFNTWIHIAVVRSSGTLKVYYNGTGGTGVTATGNIVGTNAYIGAFFDGLSVNIAGYFDDFRITKGVARYTANFTAPTAPFPDKG